MRYRSASNTAAGSCKLCSCLAGSFHTRANDCATTGYNDGYCKCQRCAGGISYRVFEPCAIHRPNIARSASVMFVLFAGGIVRVTTARSRIRAT